MLRSGGLRPWCVDLFADVDLQRVCAAQAIAASAYPRGFLDAARRAPSGPWIYTGALENHPHLIDAIARERPLWGNPGNVVRRARSAALVAEVLRQAGLPCPAIAECSPEGQGKRWLIKPRHGAGGAKIRDWRGQPIPRSCYVQEKIEGEPCSALFAGRRDNLTTFVGATRQLIGTPWLHAGGFRYCGNIGPMQLATTTAAHLQRLGEVLTKAFSLRGLFGVDFILKDGVPWPVEINPRYTAGIEILERATGACLFSHHREAFSEGGSWRKGCEGPTPTLKEGCCGKAILFARDAVNFPCEGPWQASLRDSCTQAPDYADIPRPHSRIGKGQPILTLFVDADQEADGLEILREKAQALDRRLHA